MKRRNNKKKELCQKEKKEGIIKCERGGFWQSFGI